MSMSKRNREKGARAAQRLLSGARVHTYVVGRSGPNPFTTMVLFLGGSLALAVLMFMALHVFFFPGFLVIAGVQGALNPPRAVVLCDQGLAVLTRSVWNAKPKRVIARLPHNGVQGVVTQGSYHELNFGRGEKVWLASREEKLLRESLAPFLYAPPPFIPGAIPMPPQY